MSFARSQKGLSMLSWIMVLAIVAFVASTGFKMFPHYKFLQPSYMIYSPENTRSLCYKINELIDKPPHIQSEIDDEFYWVNCTVPMINKKYCEIRSNFTTDIKKIYMGE